MDTQNLPVFDAALALPPAQRSELADKLVLSLAPPERDGNEKMITDLAAQLDAFERGELETIDGPEALAELRRRQARRQSS
ncbi:addiction module protein [Adhaeretor mobilis]|uniref:Uncharacterized protein n=1 Tax=Adhaeretor mobilis TaxID=1930276 RepID=A0A517N0L7_9BACT|nr:addiction module protein [Adhaeretor mobilis]QDT00679.1 hypothetical protein HG15A2_40180 [Adhaeretor mobilis]